MCVCIFFFTQYKWNLKLENVQYCCIFYDMGPSQGNLEGPWHQKVWKNLVYACKLKQTNQKHWYVHKCIYKSLSNQMYYKKKMSLQLKAPNVNF